jgi:starch-binding outer membrane protein, SusD/RagB family
MKNRLLARRRIRRLGTFTTLAACIAVSLSGCDSKQILIVTDPDVARPGALDNPSALPALRAGAVGAFGIAYNGQGGNSTQAASDEEQVDLSGSLSDELINTETFPTRIEFDQRAQTLGNTSLVGTFVDINRARGLSTRAITAFQKFAKNTGDSTGFPEVLALGGLTYVLLAENYCGAVPLSVVNDDGSFTFGPALTVNQQLDSAVSKFNTALAVAGAPLTATFKQLAQVGKGRALLDKGDYANAALAVAGVSTTFQYNYQHSQTTAGQNNGTWLLTNSVGRFGVAALKGGNGLPYQTDGDTKNVGFDPRVANAVRTSNGGHGFDNGVPGGELQFVQQKFPLRDSPITIADGVEARLIEAEAALQTDPVAALAILNGLRANAALLTLRGYAAGSLPPLTLQATAAAQVNQLFKERAYWLFLTSHRLGDMRRLIRQYGRGSETVFPTGAYFKGGTYGTDVNSPVPQREQNNPSYTPGSCKQNEA